MKPTIYLTLMLLAAAIDTATSQGLTEPVKPQVAQHNSPVLRLELDTTLFPELAMYNNLRFEIDPHGRKFDPRDSDETWDKIEIKKAADEPGFYVLTFANAQRHVAYRARPVFEQQDYAKALQTYEARVSAYRLKLEEKRRARQRLYEQFLIQAAALNAVTNIDDRASRFDTLANSAWDRMRELELINIDPNNPVKDISTDENYHYHPVETNYLLVPITASYRDSAGHVMDLTNVDILFKGFEVLGFLDGRHIRVAANGDNMIFGIWKNKLYVLPFEKYHELHIGPSTRLQMFTMQYVDSVYQDLRYFDLRNLIEGYQQRRP